MCGIVGYIGKERASTHIYDGLSALEYRGYDSVGISVIDERIHTIKRSGRVNTLKEYLNILEGRIGIGHTRWATHGKPTQINAHPHNCGVFSIVHNGIIENATQIKHNLINNGHTFISQTDTEVMLHLIWDNYNSICSENSANNSTFIDMTVDSSAHCDITEQVTIGQQPNTVMQEGDCCMDPAYLVLLAINRALAQLSGSFAIALLCEHCKDCIFVAKRSAPLLIGLGQDNAVVASDVCALGGGCDNALVLADDCVGAVYIDKVCCYDINMDAVQLTSMSIEHNRVQHIDKQQDYMIMEIGQCPLSIQDTMAGFGQGVDMVSFSRFCRTIDRIMLVGCGTAYHSCVTAKYLIEAMANVSVEVDIASEYRYRNPIMHSKTLFIAVSQSGETADTIFALKLAKKGGLTTMVITNAPTSTITTIADYVFITKCGQEVGVAATKSYCGQLAVFISLALLLARIKLNTDTTSLEQQSALVHAQAKSIIDNQQELKALSNIVADSQSVFYIGRNIDYATALEGSLKLKEITYMHSEGYPAGELKHGTIALISDKSLVIGIVTVKHVADKTMTALHEVKARGAKVLLITCFAQYLQDEVVDYHYLLPYSPSLFMPLLSILPLQLIAYYVAKGKNYDADKPRNLAKSVTVE